MMIEMFDFRRSEKVIINTKQIVAIRTLEDGKSSEIILTGGVSLLSEKSIQSIKTFLYAYGERIPSL